MTVLQKIIEIETTLVNFKKVEIIRYSSLKNSLDYMKITDAIAQNKEVKKILEFAIKHSGFLEKHNREIKQDYTNYPCEIFFEAKDKGIRYYKVNSEWNSLAEIKKQVLTENRQLHNRLITLNSNFEIKR